MSRFSNVNWVLLSAFAVAGWACAADSDVDEMPNVQVVFDDMEPIGVSVPTEKSAEEECTTGCSLAKHHIPDFTEYDYEQAILAYAQKPISAPSKPLESLLFYGKRTVFLMDDLGTGDLPTEHLAFLRRELRRDHALVSLRMVNEEGITLVSYGPTSVPLGAKQHLVAFGENLSAMEFNGTVMRTGVNYLWSRY